MSTLESRRWRWSHTGWLALLIVDYLSWFAHPVAPVLFAVFVAIVAGVIHDYREQTKRLQALDEAVRRHEAAKLRVREGLDHLDRLLKQADVIQSQIDELRAREGGGDADA